MDDSSAPTPKTPGPRRTGWPYVAGAVITLAIQTGWSPADVRSLAIALLTLVSVVYAAQR
jgi:hypothetical protein